MTAVYTGQWSGGSTDATDPVASGTPAIGELLVVFCAASGNTNAAPTCADDKSGAYYLAGTATWASSANTLSAFVRTKPVESATAHAVTVSPGTQTAAVVAVSRYSGMTRFGQSAVKQFNKADNGASSGTPAFTFGASVLTTNITAVAVGSGDTTTTPPASWTERTDANQSTPTTALEVATRGSGFTGTTVTWGATQSATWAACGIELDTSAVTYAGEYPTSTGAMNTAFGGGTWTNGYLCNETSGNLSPTFGSGTLTASGLTYSGTGMLTGEKAITFDANGDTALGGDILDAGTGDVVCVAVFKRNSNPGSTLRIVNRANAKGWEINDDSGTAIVVNMNTGSNVASSLAYSGTGEWCVIAMCIDRAVPALRIAMYAPSVGYIGNASDTTISGTLTLRDGTTNSFVLGGDTTKGINAARMDLDAVFVGVGASAASLVSANLMSRLHSFVTSLETTSTNHNNLLLLGVG